MNWNLMFFVNSVLFGIGLAMDAFSVSLANGLNEPNMRKTRRFLIAGTFSFYQILMPVIGWLCIHTIAGLFASFTKLIPWIALLLLGFIGTKMLIEGIRNKAEDEPERLKVGFATLMLQGVATSIDALSVGFTIAEYPAGFAVTEALIIGAVTFGICMFGLFIGQKFGTKLAGKATVLGGAILIFIGIEIFISNL